MAKPNEWEIRLSAVETDAARLRDEAAALRRDWERRQAEAEDLREEYDALRESVLRYAIACGAVDVQMAMLRARPTEGREEAAMESLRRAMEEQNEASDALRALARALQRSDGPK
jgi:predicted  nucleic acid-binding Zn-ribbon protein